MREGLRFCDIPQDKTLEAPWSLVESALKTLGTNNEGVRVMSQEYSMAGQQEWPKTHLLGAGVVRAFEKEGSQQRCGKWWQSQGSRQYIILSTFL